MNCDRSERRAWIREVAIGLGRALDQDEQRVVEDAWRVHRDARKQGGAGQFFPRDLVSIFRYNHRVGQGLNVPVST